MEIKIKKKYILYKFLNNKISKLTEAQTKTELKENIKGKIYGMCSNGHCEVQNIRK